VAEQQHRLLLGFSGEVHLQVIAEVGDAMKFCASAKRREFLSHEGAAAVDGLLVVTGRLDFHQATNGVNHLVPSLFEKVKPRLGGPVGGGWSGRASVPFFCHGVSSEVPFLRRSAHTCFKSTPDACLRVEPR
jgi:hypothetical protein